ncbi:MAG: hypothetical protein IKT08_07390 [Bacteroidales bacterium]|nr:hypothetical protein [Bacteroidales bacterium]
MRKSILVLIVATLFFGMSACKKSSSSLLLGTWGLERVEYYYIDFYGQPIESTIEAYDYVPGDMDNGIDLVFKDGKKGEWRDRDVDTIYVKISENPVVFDTIINPDTTIVTPFSYSIDDDQSALYIKTSNAETFMLDIEELSEDVFIYSNEYKVNYVEHAILKRVNSSNKTKSTERPQRVPRKPGSFISHQLLNEQR